MAGGKTISGSIAKLAGCVLLLFVHEASERRTVVMGGVVYPLVVKASSGGIPTRGKSPTQAKAGQVSGDSTIKTAGLMFFFV